MDFQSIPGKMESCAGATPAVLFNMKIQRNVVWTSFLVTLCPKIQCAIHKSSIGSMGVP